MKVKILPAIILILSITSVLQADELVRLTDKSKISILTCTPGADVYATFGHTAIRITDNELKIDVVYNYGTFNYNTENFYWKFLKRDLDYLISRQPFHRFVKEYKADHREVTEQNLNLSLDQKQRVFEALEENYLPDNRYYRYDFFFDNCATRVRDIINTGLDNQIIWNYEGILEGMTFRQIIDPYIKMSDWLDLGIYIILGMPTDRVAEPNEYMLMPLHLKNIFAKSTLEGSSNNLVSNQEVILDTSEGLKLPANRFYTSPQFVFWILFAITLFISAKNFKRKKVSWWYDAILLLVTGILGILIFFLWFMTKHGVTGNNLNILWAFPFNLLIIFFFIPKRKPRFLKYYFLVTAFLSAMVFVIWLFGLQSFHPGCIPFIFSIILRSLVIFRIQKLQIDRKSEMLSVI